MRKTMPKTRLFLVLFSLILASVAASAPVVDDISEAVFRHQMGRVKATAYYLAFGIDRRGDYKAPPVEFMARFSGQSNVKPSQKLMSIPEGAIVLCIDHIEPKENSAEVSARFIPSDLRKSS